MVDDSRVSHTAASEVIQVEAFSVSNNSQHVYETSHNWITDNGIRLKFFVGGKVNNTSRSHFSFKHQVIIVSCISSSKKSLRSFVAWLTIINMKFHSFSYEFIFMSRDSVYYKVLLRRIKLIESHCIKCTQSRKGQKLYSLGKSTFVHRSQRYWVVI